MAASSNLGTGRITGADQVGSLLLLHRPCLATGVFRIVDQSVNSPENMFFPCSGFGCDSAESAYTSLSDAVAPLTPQRIFDHITVGSIIVCVS